MEPLSWTSLKPCLMDYNYPVSSLGKTVIELSFKQKKRKQTKKIGQIIVTTTPTLCN